MISFLVCGLNFLFPFAPGTLVFLCAYPDKEKNDKIHAYCHIGLTIIAYILLIVLTVGKGRSANDPIIIFFFLFFTIAWIWGMIFGAMIIYKVRSSFHRLRIPINLNPNTYAVSVNQ